MIVTMVLSLILPFIPGKVTSAEENLDETNRTVRLTYEREDQNYEDWDVWVWNTGVKEDAIEFDNDDDGVATAFIEVASKTTKFGYKVRKGDWLEAEPGGDGIDREIIINQQDPLTKAHVIQGKEEVHIVPGIPRPAIEDGVATFYYRDSDLYVADQMDEIDKVALSINDENLEMDYEENNERYVYEYEDFPEGEFEYTFIVTRDGNSEEVTDPYHESSIIENINASLEVSGSVSPSAIDYNEHAILKLDISNEDEVEIREMYADTSRLGGSSKLKIDPELMEVTISVTHDIV